MIINILLKLQKKSKSGTEPEKNGKRKAEMADAGVTGATKWGQYALQSAESIRLGYSVVKSGSGQIQRRQAYSPYCNV